MSEKNVSHQIGVYKTGKCLVELTDSLKASVPYFPAHVHAQGTKYKQNKEDKTSEKEESSLIRISMLDYSNGKGDNAVSTYFNISPYEAEFFYSRVYIGVFNFQHASEKIFGEPDKEGKSVVTKLRILRQNEYQGKIKNYPWTIIIENGKGVKEQNSKTGGYSCKSGTYECIAKTMINMTDVDFFCLFLKAHKAVEKWERRQDLKEFFNKFYLLIKELFDKYCLLNEKKE